jgi:hypothetical protein
MTTKSKSFAVLLQNDDLKCFAILVNKYRGNNCFVTFSEVLRIAVRNEAKRICEPRSVEEVIGDM